MKCHATSNPRRIATVGTFDGVHTGHRHLLGELKCHASALGLRPTAIVLDTHPLCVVRPQAAPPQLSTFEERKEAIEAEGVEVARLGFTPQSRAETSDAFMLRIHNEMGVDALLVGHDNRFGSDRQNGPGHYRAFGQGIGVEVIVATCLPGVSSSVVRKLLVSGDIKAGNRLLGRPYGLAGMVVGGARLGRKIGFPTANLQPSRPDLLVPPAGAYATLAIVDGMDGFLPAMTNIGYRPTVAGHDAPLSIETHIFDFSGDLYGKAMRLLFIDRMRDERRFASLDELTARLRLDSAEARAIIETYTTNKTI